MNNEPKLFQLPWVNKYRELGWKPFPVPRYFTVEPIPPNTLQLVKQRYSWDWCSDIAVETGLASGLVVVRVFKAPYERWKSPEMVMETILGGFDGSACAQYRQYRYGDQFGGDRYYFFQYPPSQDIGYITSLGYYGIEILGNGCFVVVPPSLTPNMQVKWWWKGNQRREEDSVPRQIPPAPPWIEEGLEQGYYHCLKRKFQPCNRGPVPKPEPPEPKGGAQ